MATRCELFDATGTRCRGAAAGRCGEDGTTFCAAHRGFRRGVPTTDWCAACEGQTPEARRGARAVTLDQEVAASRVAQDPARLADLVRARGVQPSVGAVARVPSGGGWLRSRRPEAEDVRFWLITLEPDPEDPSREVGLGLTTHGSWVRHVRPVGSEMCIRDSPPGGHRPDHQWRPPARRLAPPARRRPPRLSRYDVSDGRSGPTPPRPLAGSPHARS